MENESQIELKRFLGVSHHAKRRQEEGVASTAPLHPPALPRPSPVGTDPPP